jgi:hypothetical protein
MVAGCPGVSEKYMFSAVANPNGTEILPQILQNLHLQEIITLTSLFSTLAHHYQSE